MRKFLARWARWLVVPVLLVLASMTGGVDGFVGWFLLAWMLFRGGPGMWQDVKWFMGWARSARVRLPRFGRRGASAGGELNA